MKKYLALSMSFVLLAECSAFDSIGGSLGGIGGSSANSSAGSSGNIFRNRNKETTPLEQRIVKDDTRVLISNVDSVQVDQYHGGLLITARGKIDNLGYSDVDLIAVNNGFPDEKGLLTYEFKAAAPEEPIAGRTTRAHEVFAGASVNLRRTSLVKRIRVIAAQNQITVSK